jgi:hypothetical protein
MHYRVYHPLFGYIDLPHCRRKSVGCYSCHCAKCGYELENDLLKSLPYTCPECKHVDVQCLRHDNGDSILRGTMGEEIPRMDLTIVKSS